MSAPWIRMTWPSPFVAGLAVLLLFGVAAGQSSTTSILEPHVRGWERHFTVTSETWNRGNRPVVAGYVINDSGFTAMKVQLLVDGLVVLRDVEELSNEEAAEILGESVASVKSRLHRARMALREQLTRALAHDLSPA